MLATAVLIDADAEHEEIEERRLYSCLCATLGIFVLKVWILAFLMASLTSKTGTGVEEANGGKSTEFSTVESWDNSDIGCISKKGKPGIMFEGIGFKSEFFVLLAWFDSPLVDVDFNATMAGSEEVDGTILVSGLETLLSSF